MKKLIILINIFVFNLMCIFAQQVNIPYLLDVNPENTFVAIIGNENYQQYRTDFTENALHAIYDAERFREYLIKQLKIPERNISFYTDATTAHIKLYLAKLRKQAENAEKKCELIFYFSGKYVTGKLSGEISLLPLDILDTDLAFAVKADEVFRKLENTPAKNILVLFDATASNVSRTWSLLNDGGEPYSFKQGVKYPKLRAFITDTKKQKVDKETIAIHTENRPEEILKTDNTPSVIHIYSPDIHESEKVITEEKDILIKGKAEDRSGIYEVSVNGEEAHLEADGTFQAKVLLGMGQNRITVQAFDTKRNSAQKTLLIERIPVKINRTKQTPNNVSETNAINFAEKAGYYAILIGINDYKDPALTDLDHPVSDTKRLYEVLKDDYSFQEGNIIMLLNASREQIISALDKLEKTLTKNDNLLMFYAGHGFWDELSSTGYWFPADAKLDNTANWIRNSTISGYISGINSKHTLLIADACFSGGIFKTRAAFTNTPASIARIYELSSRKAMTSGTLKEVPDESVFLRYLTKRLEENRDHFLPADKLFYSIKPAVLNNSDNIPQFGVIKNAGDEGGDFIFIRNQK